MKKPVISFSPVGFVLLVENAEENSGARIQTKVACKRNAIYGNRDYANTDTDVYSISGWKSHIHMRERKITVGIS